jgi:hypothetical protein
LEASSRTTPSAWSVFLTRGPIRRSVSWRLRVCTSRRRRFLLMLVRTSFLYPLLPVGSRLFSLFEANSLLHAALIMLVTILLLRDQTRHSARYSGNQHASIKCPHCSYLLLQAIAAPSLPISTNIETKGRRNRLTRQIVHTMRAPCREKFAGRQNQPSPSPTSAK